MYGIGLQLTSTTTIGGSYSPASLFTANEVGYVYDLNDATTLFKDTAGTQPVTAHADPVALRLDKSRGLALGPELVTNGDFSNGTTGWTLVDTGTGGSFSAADGRLSLVGGTNAVRAVAAITTVVGKFYRVGVTVVSSASTVLRVTTASDGSSAAGFPSLTITSAGQYSVIFVATATTTYIVGATASASLTTVVDDVTVKELAGVHAAQSDAAKRPLYSLLPANGVRNLANGSADVGNTSPWAVSGTQNGITVTKIASGTDGGLPYVDVRYQGTATGTAAEVAFISGTSRTAAVSGQQFTGSVLVQVLSGSTTNIVGIGVGVAEETAPSSYIGLAISSSYKGTTETQISATRTVTTGNQVRAFVSLEFTSGAAIDITYRIKALQFELGSTRTAYQFNYAATNIAQPPFTQVGALLYDGVDDFMVTPAINFSGTDEVFLCHGVRKTSDAARGSLVELTTGTAGRFSINAPVSAGANYEFGSVGTVGVGAFASGFAAPETAVLSGQAKISTDNALLRRNGTQIATVATDQGTGNYANAPIYFGARGGTSLFFKGYEFSGICRSALANPAQIASAEEWVRQRTAGAY